MLGLNSTQREAIGLNHILHQLTPSSPYGAEKLRQISPFNCVDSLNRHFDNIEKLMRKDLKTLRDILAHFKNISGILEKLAGSAINEVELFETKGFLLTLEHFLPVFNEINTELALADISFMPMTPALDMLDPQKSRLAPFSLDDGFSDILPVARNKITWEEQAAEELRVMSELSIQLRPHIPKFRSNIKNLGNLDLAIAISALATEHNCTRPIISEVTVMMQDMINPIVAKNLVKTNRTMTPISISLAAGQPGIITGANMGGKSVAIKTAALNVALCAIGLFAFAAKAETPLFDGISLIMQDMQDTSAGLSSFGGEVTALNTIAASINTGKDILFIALDEPARTTNPAEGAAIARAIATWLADSRHISLLATHYDNVTAPNAKYYRVAGLTNLSQALCQDNIANHMDYRLLETTATDPIPRDAIKICKLLGLDDALMARIESEYANQ